MTSQSPIIASSTAYMKSTLKEVLMESSYKAGPVIIRFQSREEAINLKIKIELKYFIMKLLYAHYNREV